MGVGAWFCSWVAYPACDCCGTRTDCHECAELREQGMLEHDCYRSRI